MILDENIFKRIEYYKKNAIKRSLFFSKKKYETIKELYEDDKKLLKDNSLFDSLQLSKFIAEKLSVNGKEYFQKYFKTSFFKGHIITTKKGYENIKNLDDNIHSMEDITRLLKNEDYILIDYESKSNLDKISIIDDNLEIKKSLVDNHPNLKEQLERLVNNKIEHSKKYPLEIFTDLIDISLEYDKRFEKYDLDTNSDFDFDDVKEIYLEIDEYGFPTNFSLEFSHKYHLIFKNGEDRKLLTATQINYNGPNINNLPNERLRWHIDINKITTKDKLKLMLLELNYIANYGYNISEDIAYKIGKNILKHHASLFRYLKEAKSDPKFDEFYSKLEEVLDARTDAEEWIKLNKLRRELSVYLDKKIEITYIDENKKLIKFPVIDVEESDNKKL